MNKILFLCMYCIGILGVDPELLTGKLEPYRRQFEFLCSALDKTTEAMSYWGDEGDEFDKLGSIRNDLSVYLLDLYMAPVEQLEIVNKKHLNGLSFEQYKTKVALKVLKKPFDYAKACWDIVKVLACTVGVELLSKRLINVADSRDFLRRSQVNFGTFLRDHNYFADAHNVYQDAQNGNIDTVQRLLMQDLQRPLITRASLTQELSIIGQKLLIDVQYIAVNGVMIAAGLGLSCFLYLKFMRERLTAIGKTLLELQDLPVSTPVDKGYAIYKCMKLKRQLRVLSSKDRSAIEPFVESFLKSFDVSKIKMAYKYFILLKGF